MPRQQNNKIAEMAKNLGGSTSLKQHNALAEMAKSPEENMQSQLKKLAALGTIPMSMEHPSAAIPDHILRKIEQLDYEYEKHEKQDQLIKNSLAENAKLVANLENKVTGLEEVAKREIDKISKDYADALTEIETKRDQINSILGHASGRVIAGDYEKSAADEKASADWLRWASLACMALIVVVLGYSFWETVDAEFHWQKSLFRVALAFLLSAPAAYLARESTKHRLQQYQHLQTSLDLKTITPYLASLPEEIQHKIKSEVASKLFSGRDLSQAGSESYPVNAQEILMELVKKIEFPKSK